MMHVQRRISEIPLFSIVKIVVAQIPEVDAINFILSIYSFHGYMYLLETFNEPLSAEVKKTWIYTFIPPYVFIV
jgi:hypothetical protein